MTAERLLLHADALWDGTGAEPLRPGEVLIEGQRIAAVGTNLDAADARTVDFPGCTLLPGLIDMHGHCRTNARLGSSRQQFQDEPVTLQPEGETGTFYRGLLAGENNQGLLQDATYRIVLGDLTDPNIGQYARYFLMPRRPDPDARLVLCYECDLSSFGDELQVVWENDAGIALGRLQE